MFKTNNFTWNSKKKIFKKGDDRRKKIRSSTIEIAERNVILSAYSAIMDKKPIGYLQRIVNK